MNFEMWQEFLKKKVKHVCEQSNSLVPALFLYYDTPIYKDKQVIAILITNWKKEEFLKQLPELLSISGADGYFFAHEAWASCSPEVLKGNISASQSNERQEMLIFLSVKRNAEPRLFIATINRTEEGKKVSEFIEQKEFKSRFIVEW
ncbi:MAG TPA: hypothetical protein ENG63_04985 [Candidatus Desulfofervidus auxilii]|uniref:Uncharacterized protein n=1 Tax=Desulfofervidus auxilii TaxID=1621989 RepID=A0A7C0Y4G2_DESA2|nr:hypothetical protein [Candidatus Desulfofervidus auxilii]